MPHAEQLAVLSELQSLNQQYTDRLDACVRQLRDESCENGFVSVTQAGKDCVDILGKQQQAWQQFFGTEEDDSFLSHRDSSTTSHPQSESDSKLSKVAAMGGTPALGAGMVLPKLSHHQLHKLANTESPAARELHAAQGRPDEPAPISPQPKVHTPDNSPPWLVELRKRQSTSRPSSPPKQ